MGITLRICWPFLLALFEEAPQVLGELFEVEPRYATNTLKGEGRAVMSWVRQYGGRRGAERVGPATHPWWGRQHGPVRFHIDMGSFGYIG